MKKERERRTQSSPTEEKGGEGYQRAEAVEYAIKNVNCTWSFFLKNLSINYLIKNVVDGKHKGIFINSF